LARLDQRNHRGPVRLQAAAVHELEKRFDVQFKAVQFKAVFDAIRELMAPPRRTARRLGFRVWAQTS